MAYKYIPFMFKYLPSRNVTMATTDEILAVVDENDRVIGTQTRNKIHTENLRHRAVHILVFNDQEQLFLQKRALIKDINPGLWDTSAAGHVNAGEDYAQCAQREINEELGVPENTPLEFLFKLPASTATGMEFIKVYRCRHNGPLTLAAVEIEQGDWFSVKKICQRVFSHDPRLTQSFQKLWLEYLNF
jgi:isopentenyl-diphosphate delta-isomerase type 1